MVAAFVLIRRIVGGQECIHLIQSGANQVDEAVNVVVVAMSGEEVLEHRNVRRIKRRIDAATILP